MAQYSATYDVGKIGNVFCKIRHSLVQTLILYLSNKNSKFKCNDLKILRSVYFDTPMSNLDDFKNLLHTASAQQQRLEVHVKI